MGGRKAPRRSAPGGDRIQAPRPAHPRLIPSGAALLAAAGVAAYPALSADRLAWLPGALAVAALALLAAGLGARRAALIAWSLAALGGEYAAWLVAEDLPVDTRAPVVAAGLIIVGELAFEGVEPRAAGIGADLVTRDALRIAGLAVAAIAGGAAVLVVALIPLDGGVALTAVGVGAAVLALALIAGSSRRSP